MSVKLPRFHTGSLVKKYTSFDNTITIEYEKVYHIGHVGIIKSEQGWKIFNVKTEEIYDTNINLTVAKTIAFLKYLELEKFDGNSN